MSGTPTFRKSGTADGVTARGVHVPWHSVAYLAWREAWKNRNSHLVSVAVALVFGFAAASTFGLVSGVAGGSPAFAVLNLVFVLCVAVLPRTGAWPANELLRDVGGISSESHVAFLKTLPLTLGQITAARGLIALCSVMVLSPVFLFSFYVLSEPLRDRIGLGELALFVLFWAGCALVAEAVGLFTEMSLRGQAGFWIYMAGIFLLSAFLGGSSYEGFDVVSWSIELTRSVGPLMGLAFPLGCILLALSCLATAQRLEKRGVGS